MTSGCQFRDFERRVIAARRFENGAKCAHCDESRIECLIAGHNPVICYQCDCIDRGKPDIEYHHLIGRHNSQIGITISANDHRELSFKQYRWPEPVLRNPDRNQLTIAAAIALCTADMLTYFANRLKRQAPELTEFHAFISTVTGILADFLYRAAVFLKNLSGLLVERFGREWWKEIMFYQPKWKMRDAQKTRNRLGRNILTSKTADIAVRVWPKLSSGTQVTGELRNPNKYDARCIDCKEIVPPGHGELIMHSGKWVVSCLAIQPGRSVTASHRRNHWVRPESTLTIHVAARRDLTQNLLFGFYLYEIPGGHADEGLFYSEHLSDEERQTLRSYAKRHRLKLLTLDQFIGNPHFCDRVDDSDFSDFFRRAYEVRSLVAGWDLPFVLSRLAWRAGRPRSEFWKDGYRLELWRYNHNGKESASPYRPAVWIKSLLPGVPVIRFTPFKREREILEKRKASGLDNSPFGGHLLSAKSLTYALTGNEYSLCDACEMFGVSTTGLEQETDTSDLMNTVTEDGIELIRNRAKAAAELTSRLADEFDTYNVTLEATRDYSPSSITKAILRDMGIRPRLEVEPEFPPEHLGYAASAFYGSRAGVRIRNEYVPCVCLDFRSNYATTNCLMGHWEYITAGRINIIEHCRDEITGLLESILQDTSLLFNAKIWKNLNGFVKLMPKGDLLPVRTQSSESHEWYTTVAPVTGRDPHDALWYALPDVIASMFYTGRIPKIVDAFRLAPEGKTPGMKRIKLRGQLEIDPERQNFFEVAMEERHSLKEKLKRIGDNGPESIEAKRLAGFLKLAGNIAAYGLFAEMNTDAAKEGTETDLVCWGKDGSYPFTVTRPEVPGEYCFPPFASLITAGARLLMAMLEYAVTAEGGTYVMEATDSMAIAATHQGGTITLSSGEEINTLSFSTVETIRESFAALNPTAIPGSILDVKLDSMNRQTYCRAISVNRHAFYTINKHRSYQLIEEESGYSEHTLGNYMNPFGENDNRWIRDYWNDCLPDLDGVPAIQELPLSNQHLMVGFRDYNHDKPYYSQVKPFSLFMTCRIDEFSRDELQERRHLVKPYDPSPNSWKDTPWINLVTGERHWVTTDLARPAISSRMKKGDKSSRVMSYGDVVLKHKYRAETRYCDSKGVTCNTTTTGMLYRMAISISGIHYIGKETHELQRVFLGMARADEVYTFYEHDWTDEIRDKLRPVPRAELIEWLSDKGSGLSKSQINKILSGKHQPNPKDRKILINITRELEEYYSSVPFKYRARYAREQCERLHVTPSELSRIASISRPTATLFLNDKPVRLSTLKKIETSLSKLTLPLPSAGRPNSTTGPGSPALAPSPSCPIQGS